MMPAPISSS
uniref:Uncharacterized protein n=1 Tax=Anguilla anguilla TaxID=7936 RepID=A0A0E9VTE3_ANGAN